MEYIVNRFKELLTKENEVHNLVSRKTGIRDLDRHIEDSLQLNQLVDLSGKSLIDIGSGAGFPALILALGNPGLAVTLVEADNKKSAFLQMAARELELPALEVVCRRAEELGQDQGYREKYDICTSRAVAELRILLEYGVPLVRVGGWLYLWKGRNWEKEVEEAQNALQLLGAKVERVFDYSLMEDRDRVILGVRKLLPTEERYPRRVGIPSKRPL